MTHKKFWLGMPAMALVFAMTVVGCDNGSTGGGGEDLATKSAISAKWELSDGPYASFEFTMDNMYIVIDRDYQPNQNVARAFGGRAAAPAETNPPASNLSKFHIGTYKVNKDGVITLDGFGTMDVIKVTPETFAFSFKLENSNDVYEYNAVKVEDAITGSSRTNMLCRHWIITNWTGDGDYEGPGEPGGGPGGSDSGSASIPDGGYPAYPDFGDGEDYPYEYEGEEEDDDYDEEMTRMMGATVIFSKAGTYLVMYKNGEAGLSEWRWGDRAETVIQYSWGNWESYGTVQVTELTAKSLKILEHGYTWILTPR